jgi:hypothetical protein
MRNVSCAIALAIPVVGGHFDLHDASALDAHPRSGVHNFYRFFVSAGVLWAETNIGGVKTDHQPSGYNPAQPILLQIRNDGINAIFETAPAVGGSPGTWTQAYSEGWSSSVVISQTTFELKTGESTAEANANTVVWDHFASGASSESVLLSDNFTGSGVDPQSGAIVSSAAPPIQGLSCRRRAIHSRSSCRLESPAATTTASRPPSRTTSPARTPT